MEMKSQLKTTLHLVWFVLWTTRGGDTPHPLDSHEALERMKQKIAAGERTTTESWNAQNGPADRCDGKWRARMDYDAPRDEEVLTSFSYRVPSHAVASARFFVLFHFTIVSILFLFWPIISSLHLCFVFLLWHFLFLVWFGLLRV